MPHRYAHRIESYPPDDLTVSSVAPASSGQYKFFLFPAKRVQRLTRVNNYSFNMAVKSSDVTTIASFNWGLYKIINSISIATGIPLFSLVPGSSISLGFTGVVNAALFNSPTINDLILEGGSYWFAMLCRATWSTTPPLLTMGGDVAADAQLTGRNYAVTPAVAPLVLPTTILGNAIVATTQAPWMEANWV